MKFLLSLRSVTPALFCGCLLLSGCGGEPMPTNDATVAKESTTNTAFVVPTQEKSAHASAEHGEHAHAEMAPVTDAICVLVSVGDSKVEGKLHFSQVDGGIQVTGEVSGLTPGMHGFHVHEFGDLTDLETGKSTGGHFNPDHKMHGSRDAEERHAGDFGNIEADDNGVAKIDFVDKMIKMAGSMSIVGRGIVIHADEDKYTQPTGDAGGRVAIGVIGVAKNKG